MKLLVAYYRVSTRKQGCSGLGLEDQREAVARFAKTAGFEAVAELTEIETGKGVCLERALRSLPPSPRLAGMARLAPLPSFDRLTRCAFHLGTDGSARPVLDDRAGR
jgi:hypothetical protein